MPRNNMMKLLNGAGRIFNARGTFMTPRDTHK